MFKDIGSAPIIELTIGREGHDRGGVGRDEGGEGFCH